MCYWFSHPCSKWRRGRGGVRIELDLTPRVWDNKQPQHKSRQGGGREERSETQSEDNEGNRKRQEKTEGIRGPAATPEKKTWWGKDWLMLHRIIAISTFISHSQCFLLHLVRSRLLNEDQCHRCNKCCRSSFFYLSKHCRWKLAHG